MIKNETINGNIHCHSEYSMFDGASHVKDLVKSTKEMGCDTFVLTDHGTMTGIFEAWDMCEKEGLNFIPGVEAYVKSESNDEVYHMIMLSKSMKGYHGIAKAVTRSHNNIHKNHPCIDRAILEELFGADKEYENEVIITSACIQGELSMAYLHNIYADKNIKKIKEDKDKKINPAKFDEYEKLKESLNNFDADFEKLNTRKKEVEALSKKALAKKINAEKKILAAKGLGEAEIEKIFKDNALPEGYEASNEEVELFATINKVEEAKKELTSLKKEVESEKKKRSKLNESLKELEKIISKAEAFDQKIALIEESKYSKEKIIELIKDTLKFYTETFKDNFYIELQYHGMKEEAYVMPLLAKLAKNMNIKVVASNDVHMANKEDVHRRQLIKAKRFNTYSEAEVADKELYLKTDDELKAMLNQILPEDVTDEAIDNIYEIFGKCDVKREKETHYPKAIIKGEDADIEIERICRENIAKRYKEGEWDKAHEDRLCYELSVIKKMGFADYHLLEMDFCETAILYGNIPLDKLDEAPLDKEELLKYCEDNGYDTGIGIGPGRGSAAGSIVCYLLYITHIEPIKYDLLFERYLNVERVTMPDIDSDFEPHVRNKVVEYCENKYGKNRLAQIVTKGTQVAKGSIRNCSRYLGGYEKNDNQFYAPLADLMAKTVPNKPGISLFDEDVDSLLMEKFGNNKDAMKILKDAKEVEGYISNYGQHAAGVVITPEDIENIVPLMISDEGVTLTQCDMIQVEKLGMLKFDFLRLKNLTYISNTVKLLKKKGITIDLYNLPLEKDIFEEVYAQGRTTAVFQFESGGIREMLKKLKPSCLEDVILANAIYRPGPMDDIPDIIKAKASGNITYPIPELEPILNKTYGNIVYQEQVMQIFQSLSGFSLGQADLVRRAMSKKHLDEIMAEKEAFLHGDDSRNIDGCEKRGIDLVEAEKIFEKMLRFAAYAFNKSHAAVYSYVSYMTAYLKHRYPVEFLCSVMDESPLTKMPALIKEAISYGIKVLPPSVNESYESFTTVSDSEIRYGLSHIKTVGKDAAVVIKEREENGPFTSVKDFMQRVKIDKSSLEALIKAGAFDDFIPSRKALLSVLEPLTNAVKCHKASEKKYEEAQDILTRVTNGEVIKKLDPKKAYQNMQNAKLKADDDKLSLISIFIPQDIVDDKDEKLLVEHEYLGTFVSDHPLRHYMDSKDTIETLELSKNKDDLREITGIITNLRLTTVKKTGKSMAFFDLEDKTGIMPVVVFNKTYEAFEDMLKEGNVIKFIGLCRMEEKDDATEDDDISYQLIASEFTDADKVTDSVCVAIRNLTVWPEVKEKLKSISSGGHKLVIYDEALGEFRNTKEPIYVSDEIYKLGLKVKAI